MVIPSWSICPIQVKQSERIGRNVVDNFETAVERSGKHKGYVVGFSFTRGALRGGRSRQGREGMEIELVKISMLIRAPRIE